MNFEVYENQFSGKAKLCFSQEGIPLFTQEYTSTQIDELKGFFRLCREKVKPQECEPSYTYSVSPVSRVDGEYSTKKDGWDFICTESTVSTHVTTKIGKELLKHIHAVSSLQF